MILKQSVGIDVAQKELVVTMGCMLEDLSYQLRGSGVFANNEKGFTELLDWVEQRSTPEAPLRFVLEATGVYHEGLAYFLAHRHYHLTVVMPNKMVNFFRTLSVNTVTDKSMSEAIARFGLEKNLTDWNRPDEQYKRLRQLARERDQLIEQRTMVKNQIHAEKAEAQPHEGSLKRAAELLKVIDGQLASVAKDIHSAVKVSGAVCQAVQRLTSIPGIGEVTAVRILSETDGFALIRNVRQLASYAGLDVRQKQSGTSVRGKATISKKGNRHLRKALHMPALSAVRSDERFKGIFHRLVSRHGIKMKALVAIQRKLLELCYILFKNETIYQKDYLAVNTAAKIIERS